MVSTLAFEVSVAFDESTFIVVSLVLFTEVDESTFADVSVELPEPLPLQAAIDKEIASASKGTLNAFFIGILFNVLIINATGGVLFVEEVRKSESPEDGKSGSPEDRKTESPEDRKFENSKIRKTQSPEYVWFAWMKVYRHQNFLAFFWYFANHKDTDGL